MGTKPAAQSTLPINQVTTPVTQTNVPPTERRYSGAPIGHFEQSTVMTADMLELGGSLLSRYDTQMLKTRLIAQSTDVAWTMVYFDLII